MPKVKFLQDFQGRETKEAFFRKDEVVDIADELVDRLLADKRVELVLPAVVTASEPQFENAYPELEPAKKRGRK